MPLGRFVFSLDSDRDVTTIVAIGHTLTQSLLLVAAQFGCATRDEVEAEALGQAISEEHFLWSQSRRQTSSWTGIRARQTCGCWAEAPVTDTSTDLPWASAWQTWCWATNP